MLFAVSALFFSLSAASILCLSDNFFFFFPLTDGCLETLLAQLVNKDHIFTFLIFSNVKCKKYILIAVKTSCFHHVSGWQVVTLKCTSCWKPFSLTLSPLVVVIVSSSILKMSHVLLTWDTQIAPMLLPALLLLPDCHSVNLTTGCGTNHPDSDCMLVRWHFNAKSHWKIHSRTCRCGINVVFCSLEYQPAMAKLAH